MGSEEQGTSHNAPADGEYRCWRWARWLIVLCAIPSVGITWQTLCRSGVPVEGYEWVGIGFIVAIAVATVTHEMSQPRRAVWDPSGIEFTWHWGTSKHYAWDEVIGLLEEYEGKTYLLTSTNERIRLVSGGDGYDELLARVKAHLEERKRMEGG